MIPCRFQTLLFGVLPLAFAACGNPTPVAAYSAATTTPLGIDLGSSGGSVAVHPAVATSAAPSGRLDGARTHLVHEGHGGATVTGTVNAVDAAAHRLNVSHGAIQALGWPPMTMDFPASPSVNLNAIKPGEKVTFTLDKGSDGMPVIDTVTPVGGGK